MRERVVVRSRIIHDYGLIARGLNTNDTEGRVLFTAGDREYCMRTSASMIGRKGAQFFTSLDGAQVVRRYQEDDYLCGVCGR